MPTVRANPRLLRLHQGQRFPLLLLYLLVGLAALFHSFVLLAVVVLRAGEMIVPHSLVLEAIGAMAALAVIQHAVVGIRPEGVHNFVDLTVVAVLVSTPAPTVFCGDPAVDNARIEAGDLSVREKGDQLAIRPRFIA